MSTYAQVDAYEEDWLKELLKQEVFISLTWSGGGVTFAPGWSMGQGGIRGTALSPIHQKGKSVFIPWSSVLFVEGGSGAPHREDYPASAENLEGEEDPCAKGHTKCYGDCNRCLVCEYCKCRSGAL